MWNCNLAYRFASGRMEGFSGCGFMKSSARENALRKIRIKLELLREAFDESRLIENPKQLSGDDLRQLRADWKVSQHSEIT